MAEFYVCWNESLKRVRIHRADCAQLLRSRLTEIDGTRKGRLAVGTYDEAWRIVRELKRSRPVFRSYGRIECRICNPQIADAFATKPHGQLHPPVMRQSRMKST